MELSLQDKCPLGLHYRLGRFLRVDRMNIYLVFTIDYERFLRVNSTETWNRFYPRQSASRSGRDPRASPSLTALLRLVIEVSTRMSLGEWCVLSPPSSAPDSKTLPKLERGAPGDAMT